MANVKLTFEGLVSSNAYSGYLANYDGYKGFDFKDMYLMTEHAITQLGMWHTGFHSALRGMTDAFFSAYLNASSGYGKGYILSPTKETFNLGTGLFASAWDSSQQVTFTGYDGSHERGAVTLTLTQNAQKINFANYGHDFWHITKLKEFTNAATGGSFGKGWQVVVDNLRAHWNGAIPGGHIVHAAHLISAGSQSGTHGGSHSADHNASAGHGSAYHSELTTLHGDHSAGLTAEFNLPQAEHLDLL